MENILVHLNNPQWTTQALHLASSLARNTHSQVVLLDLILAHNPGLLGTDIAVPIPDPDQWRQFEDYASICEDYGVVCDLQPMHYVSLVGALEDAVNIREATVLFTKYPDSPFTAWNQLRAWWLKRVFQKSDCQLYLIEESTREILWQPKFVTNHG